MAEFDFVKRINWPIVLVLSLAQWGVAFIMAMVYMALLGINPQDPDLQWNMSHPKYWTFEALINLTSLILLLLLLYYYYQKMSTKEIQWLPEGITVGLVIMAIQFFLDFLVIVLLFGNDDYFVGVVTIAYLTIPFWSTLMSWYVNGRT